MQKARDRENNAKRGKAVEEVLEHGYASLSLIISVNAFRF